MQIKVISDVEELLPYIPAWEQLAGVSLEPNPFYEHWMLMPAVRCFGQGRSLRFVLIFRDDPARPSSAPLLCGFFPLERQQWYLNLPISGWSLWKHRHCFLTTPLMHAEHARETLAALFDWLASADGNCSLLELRHVPGEGKFHQLFIDHLHQTSAVPLMWECFTRAFFEPMAGGDEYLSAALTGKQRSEMRRRVRLLSEKGPLQYSVLEPDGDIRLWSETFLKLEASGWKGREGSALACQDTDRTFFLDVMAEGFRLNRLLLPAMVLDGAPIAMNSFLLAGQGAFYFKTGFDEQYAKLGPGFYLECETIRDLHRRPEIRWMDTCTNSENDVYNRLFLHRKTIQTLLVPVGKGPGTMAVSAIPLLRSVKHLWQSRRQAAPAEREKVAD